MTRVRGFRSGRWQPSWAAMSHDAPPPARIRAAPARGHAARPRRIDRAFDRDVARRAGRRRHVVVAAGAPVRSDAGPQPASAAPSRRRPPRHGVPACRPERASSTSACGHARRREHVDAAAAFAARRGDAIDELRGHALLRPRRRRGADAVRLTIHTLEQWWLPELTARTSSRATAQMTPGRLDPVDGAPPEQPGQPLVLGQPQHGLGQRRETHRLARLPHHRQPPRSRTRRSRRAGRRTRSRARGRRGGSRPHGAASPARVAFGRTASVACTGPAPVGRPRACGA